MIEPVEESEKKVETLEEKKEVEEEHAESKEAAAEGGDADGCGEEEVVEKIVFVPGFKGSKLVDANTREVLWITGWGVLPFRVPPIALPGERTLQLEGFHCHKGPVVADGPLDSLFGGFYQVYGPFLKFAKKKWGDDFSTFAYDWRQDNTVICHELENYITKNFVTSGDDKKKKTRLVFLAHSNGGLVIWAMLSDLVAKYGADGSGCSDTERELIKLLQESRVVFVGTPFQPIEPILADITPGTAGHYWFLPSDVLSTFPSLFQLMLPPREQCDPLMYDVDFWVNRRIGPFGASSMQPELVTEFKAIIRDMLEMTDTFHTKSIIEGFAGTLFDHLRVGILCSKTRMTPTGLPASLFDSSTPIDWTAFKTEPGDGRVPFSSATAVPGGLDVETMLFSEKDHGALLEDFPQLLSIISTLTSPKQPPTEPEPSSSTSTTTTTTTAVPNPVQDSSESN